MPLVKHRPKDRIVEPADRLAMLTVTMPRTRFQGSKRRLASWIAKQVETLKFDTVLDAFGGTGSVAYEFKRRGYAVTYNDLLAFNRQIGLALIENRNTRLTDLDIARIATRDPTFDYDDLIERTFRGTYFTAPENRWLDVAVQNIRRISNRLRRAVAYHALFQASLAKRPYNLFHRRNLYMRRADVPRSFGNKTTWDRPFDQHFRAFAEEANAAVFDNGRSCRALNRDILDVEGAFDLVYIDPPYTAANGVGVDYRGFYHFLEGMAQYGSWSKKIDWDSRHRRLKPVPNRWSVTGALPEAFAAVFERFADSILVASYRSDGIPAVSELERMMRRVKRRVRTVVYDRYQYALSTNRKSREVLLIGY